MAAPFEEVWIDFFAEVSARLAHRFADRAAVLWRAGYDEESWNRLEIACLEAIAAERRAGHTGRSARFAASFADARARLREPAIVPTAPLTRPTVSELGPTAAGSMAASEELDPLDAMATLATATQASPGASGGSRTG